MAVPSSCTNVDCTAGQSSPVEHVVGLESCDAQEEQPTWSKSPAEDQVQRLPFLPLSMTFRNINYYVGMPKVSCLMPSLPAEGYIQIESSGSCTEFWCSTLGLQLIYDV